MVVNGFKVDYMVVDDGFKDYFKGCGMRTLFVLVSPCFRENVVVTCKIGSFCVV